MDNFDIDISLPEDYDVGFTIVENELFDFTDGMSPEKKVVLFNLRRYVGSMKNETTGKIEAKKSAAWPSLNNLAIRSGISKPTVIKCLDFFEWMKWIRKIHTSTGTGKGVNKYILNIPDIRIYLGVLRSRNITFDEIEEYFNSLYQNKKNGGKELLDKGCVFISNNYSKEFVEELLKPYKKPPKKKREVKK